MRNFSARRTRTSIFLALGAVAALTLTGCSGDGDGNGEGPEETPVTEETPTTEAPAQAEAIEIPDTPVGEVAQKMVDTMNAADDTTEADWEGLLHESFTAQVPVSDFVGLLNTNIRPAQPFVPTAYEGGERQSVTTLDAAIGDPIDLSIVLDPEGLITGLTFTPAAPES